MLYSLSMAEGMRPEITITTTSWAERAFGLQQLKQKIRGIFLGRLHSIKSYADRFKNLGRTTRTVFEDTEMIKFVEDEAWKHGQG